MNERCSICDEKFTIDDEIVVIEGEAVHDDYCAKEHLYNENVDSSNTYDYESLFDE